jgi:hypothetical protein
MTTRKAIVLVNGLFQELNTPGDKLDFAGNTTSDLTEGTRLYYTDARARGAISVSNSGTGYGSLAYNSATGVITYTVVTNANIWSGFTVATGSGLTYNNSTGQFGTNAIPNSQLANSSITVGSTSISLGGTTATLSGLTSVSATTLNAGTTVNVGTVGDPNSITIDNAGITFEGSIADGFETVLSVINPTADRSIQLPDSSGTIALLNSISVANSGTGFGSISYDNSTGVLTYNVVTAANVRGTLTASTTGTGFGSLTYNNSTGNFDFAVVTSANIRGTLSVAVGSGLTYSSTTGEFGTSAIPNSQLANSNIQIGSTSIALGSSTNTIAGLSSLTASKLYAGTLGTANSVYLDNSNGSVNFEGATANAFVTSIVVTDPTATRTVTLQDLSGTVALNTNKLSFFSATTSAELAGVISDETGTGSLVFANSPSFTTPSLGVATATSINKVSITAPATGSTLTIADGKTLTVSNTLTFTGTDGSSVNFGSGGAIAYLGVNNAFTGANTFTNATGQTFRQTATQDGIIVSGRAGGSSSYAVTITPGTLTGNRILTAPDETGTVATQDFATAIAIALG